MVFSGQSQSLPASNSAMRGVDEVTGSAKRKIGELTSNPNF
jgi:uncharacterized protein YjbJ (UPF0337 family)